MSGTLYLVRHGIAFDAAPGESDAMRSLTPRGARKIHRAALGLRRLGVCPDRILASPLVRAQQTAELLRTVLCPDRGIETCPSLSPGSEPFEALEELAGHRGAKTVFLVGHQPNMGELLGYLLSGGAAYLGFDFKKGAVAAVDVARLPPVAPGSLRWFLTARQLALLGRRPRSAQE